MAIKTFLIAGCIHCNQHDPDGIDWLIDEVKDRQPDELILNGDIIDTACLSRFTQVGVASLREEYDSVEEVVGRIIDAAKGAKLVWIAGNHEGRLARPEWAALSDVLDYRKQLDCAKAFKHIPYVYGPEGTHRIGQVTAGHGFNISQGGCKKEAIQLGVPNGLYVHNHTHRPHPVHRISYGQVKLPYWHVNGGTFIRPKPDYMATSDDSLWGQGFVAGHANTKRIYDRRHGWEAELVLNKMHWSDGEDVVAGGKVVA